MMPIPTDLQNRRRALQWLELPTSRLPDESLRETIPRSLIVWVKYVIDDPRSRMQRGAETDPWTNSIFAAAPTISEAQTALNAAQENRSGPAGLPRMGMPVEQPIAREAVADHWPTLPLRRDPDFESKIWKAMIDGFNRH